MVPRACVPCPSGRCSKRDAPTADDARVGVATSQLTLARGVRDLTLARGVRDLPKAFLRRVHLGAEHFLSALLDEGKGVRVSPSLGAMTAPSTALLKTHSRLDGSRAPPCVELYLCV